MLHKRSRNSHDSVPRLLSGLLLPHQIAFDTAVVTATRFLILRALICSVVREGGEGSENETEEMRSHAADT